MRDESTTQANRASGLDQPPPWKVIEVRALSDRKLFVRFLDDTQGHVDLSALVDGQNPGVFAALRDAGAFGRVFVSSGAVTWPGEIDLAPDAMYDAIRATGFWRPT